MRIPQRFSLAERLFQAAAPGNRVRTSSTPLRTALDVPPRAQHAPKENFAAGIFRALACMISGMALGCAGDGSAPSTPTDVNTADDTHLDSNTTGADIDTDGSTDTPGPGADIDIHSDDAHDATDGVDSTDAEDGSDVTDGADVDVTDGEDTTDTDVPDTTACEPKQEYCNGLDDDCDDIVDNVLIEGEIEERVAGEACDDYTLPDNTCFQDATWECQNDIKLPPACVVHATPITEETCDKIDNDCDGATDEALTQDCGDTNVGECNIGTSTCTDGTWSECTGAILPAAETCNGKDDDCDGDTDEAFPELGNACDNGQLGVCATTGVIACDTTGAASCNAPAGATATPEQCDTLDNDCDGAVDEALLRSCGTDVGECATGTETCDNGTWSACDGAIEATSETCNTKDDNCDGSIDEAFALLGAACDNGKLGACATTGAIVCDGDTATTCDAPAGAAATEEICDNIDNNCDGATDNVDGLGTACQITMGLCVSVGAYTCDIGAKQLVCNAPAITPTVEICDNEDNDCNGIVDNIAPTATTCGTGVCASVGESTCSDGATVDTCAPLPPLAATDTTCDGIDDDCDGIADDDVAPIATNCGAGECVSTGTLACVEGELIDSCTPGDPLAAEVCDGADNNCNSATDEGIASTPTTCGIGACATSGALACVGGALKDSCTPQAPTTAIDNSCNSIDDDCDGAIDDNYAGAATQCGVGACVTSGVMACVGGQLSDTCTPLAPASSTDTTCDGIDNNCNGATDEGYATQTTTCGIGACATTGALTCIGGNTSNSCTPKTPSTTTDNSCNGIDDDCDGQTDEDFVGAATQCGVGACAASGVTLCIGGQMSNTCTPLAPASSTDTTCDGIDNNCNGATDEGYVTKSTSCGVGECASTGVTSCSTGVEKNSCAPKAPTAEICDGKDNNCNGTVDTDVSGYGTACSTTLGLCSNQGTKTCNVSTHTLMCNAPMPVPQPEICDDKDNDCDGIVDTPACDISCVASPATVTIAQDDAADVLFTTSGAAFVQCEGFPKYAVSNNSVSFTFAPAQSTSYACVAINGAYSAPCNTVQITVQ